MKLLLLLLTALVLWGCTSSQGRASYEPSPEYGTPMRVERKAMAKNSMRLEGVNLVAQDIQSAPAPEASGGGAAGVFASASAQTQTRQATAPARMVYYNGGVTLKATQPDAVLDTAEARALSVTPKSTSAK